MVRGKPASCRATTTAAVILLPDNLPRRIRSTRPAINPRPKNHLVLGTDRPFSYPHRPRAFEVAPTVQQRRVPSTSCASRGVGGSIQGPRGQVRRMRRHADDGCLLVTMELGDSFSKNRRVTPPFTSQPPRCCSRPLSLELLQFLAQGVHSVLRHPFPRAVFPHPNGDNRLGLLAGDLPLGLCISSPTNPNVTVKKYPPASELFTSVHSTHGPHRQIKCVDCLSAFPQVSQSQDSRSIRIVVSRR